ncbi:hypothetical protein NLJ89_g4470 [Agrocybe chaxingu]|uniref:Tuberin N-terminal domain-containing protein n=1 Tax=Agrocybe chaxingu TaxID=84603 RepID=A0A9W8MXZ8_9AGAR|nr:hypothetical protein NLJ89_g4470 [Agrocybe chaxingu]
MSRQEPEPSTRQRQRANTASFAPFSAWRKTRPEQHTPPPVTLPQPVLSLQGLIDALTPPSVPSLAHARALATALSNYSPLPRRELLNPLLSVLCAAEAPPAIQAAGFDVLSAYWENHEATSLGTPERLSYFSLFLGSSTSWAVDLWEPRFKALRALTKDGTEIMGVESNVIDTLQWWIEGAFDGLIKPPSSIDRSERTERERSIELIAKFLEDILAKDSIKSRIMDEKMAKSRKKNNLEDKITEMLSSILSGPYSATSMLVLRQHLFPSSPPQPSRIAIMTSLGAHRTLHNHVRRALCARLAQADISCESSTGYSHSGAPVHLELQGDLMEKAWPKDDYTASSVGVGGIGWDGARLGKALAESVSAWIRHEFDDANVKSEEEKRTAWEKERRQGRDP